MPAIVLVLAIALLVPACGRRSTPVGEGGPAQGDSPPPAEAGAGGEDPARSAGLPVPGPGEEINPLTGLPVKAEALRRRIVLVSVDNNPRARPQSGLPAADLVYEIPVEGGISRFMALYLAGEAERVGPVRSSRHDMLDIVLEWDAVWAHAGGSPQHYDRVKRLGVADLDDVLGAHGGGVFWRTKDRKAPHNLYTSTGRLRDKIAELRWDRLPPARQPFRFVPARELPEGFPAHEVVIRVPRSHSDVVTYRYDPLRRLYLRYVNGKPHRDLESDEVLTATNVIVQFVGARVIPGDREGRLELDMTGEGRSIMISGGAVREGRWVKEGPDAPTRWLERDGQPAALAPGQTWVLIVPEDAEVKASDGQ